MSDNPYNAVKGGRLSFKGGVLATRSNGVDKKSKKKKKDKKKLEEIGEEQIAGETIAPGDGDEAEAIYTIDAAKKMKYEDIFPVETKKFGYDPKATKSSMSVEAALDDRVKKKADREPIAMENELRGFLEMQFVVSNPSQRARVSEIRHSRDSSSFGGRICVRVSLKLYHYLCLVKKITKKLGPGFCNCVKSLKLEL